MGYSHIFWALFWKMRKVDWWYDITAKIHPGSPFPEQAQEMPCVTQPPNHPETQYSGSLDLITWMPPTLKAVQKSFVTPTRIYCVAQGTIFKILLIIYNRKECKKEYTHTHTYTYTSHTHTHTHLYIYICGFPGGPGSKEPVCQCRRHKRHQFNPWVRKIPWRRTW